MCVWGVWCFVTLFACLFLCVYSPFLFMYCVLLQSLRSQITSSPYDFAVAFLPALHHNASCSLHVNFS